MGAPVSKLESAEEKTAEALLKAFRHMEAGERRKHATVFNYWLAIRRGRDLPPIRDLDPLEISDVAPWSVLLEIVDGGEDAEIRHAGEVLKGGANASKLSQAPNPSVLSSIAGKLGIIAISRDALAFEETFAGDEGMTRCSVTLLPFSTSGDAVDFVYGLASVETDVTETVETPELSEEETAEAETAVSDIETDEEQAPVEQEPAVAEAPEPVLEEPTLEPPVEVDQVPEVEVDRESEVPAAEPPPAASPDAKPGFSKIFDALAGAKGFFGTVASAEPAPEHEAEPEPEPEPESLMEKAALEPEPLPDEQPVAEAVEPVTEAVLEAPEAAAEERVTLAEDPAPVPEPEDIEPPRVAMEGSLQSKLTQVRSKADEARTAKLRAEAALIEGLSAAYDFALDAEEAPEEYLKLVEAQGLKIQLRSPMKPVVKLAFDGYCDGATIAELEAVLAWALKQDLPRGTLAERIEAEGGISAVLNGHKRAA